MTSFNELIKIEEAKFSTPKIMYHGTSTKFLHSILKNGIVPFPSKKVWDKDTDSSVHTASLVSHSGSYWASNMGLSLSSAYTTAKKFGGGRLLICAQIQEQSSYMDEDSVVHKIKWILGKAFSISTEGKVASDAYGVLMLTYYSDLSRRKIMQEEFAKNIHEEFKMTPQHPINNAFLNKLLDVSIVRVLAHFKKEEERSQYGGYGNFTYYYNYIEGEKPIIPSIEEAERNFGLVIEQFTKTYKKYAYKGYDRLSHTLRQINPVKFSGANKIICILEEPPYYNENHRELPWKIYYGRIPDDFFDQYAERIGRNFPGVVDANTNKIVVPKQTL